MWFEGDKKHEKSIRHLVGFHTDDTRESGSAPGACQLVNKKPGSAEDCSLSVTERRLISPGLEESYEPDSESHSSGHRSVLILNRFMVVYWFYTAFLIGFTGFYRLNRKCFMSQVSNAGLTCATVYIKYELVCVKSRVAAFRGIRVDD